ncbi:MAG: hypothetical protein KKC76_16970 [Proteobacteria bacterium]|nr:hypothetical protein [Pseudomonadota bacterium]MBU4295868.1 hypothetical protein [Pseudomonadota bacterium]MCG2747024.1 hypothetical protein [Desulfobulbaceae bacterium]
MFLQFVVGLTDVYVAGLFRPEVQGAVGFGSQVLFFFSVFANGLGVGIVAIIARSVGIRDQYAMWHTARQGLLLAVLVTSPQSLIGIVLGSSYQLYWFLPEKVALSTQLGAVGVWAAMVVSMILQGIFMSIRFRRGRWKDIDFAGQPLTASR